MVVTVTVSTTLRRVRNATVGAIDVMASAPSGNTPGRKGMFKTSMASKSLPKQVWNGS